MSEQVIVIVSLLNVMTLDFPMQSYA